MSQTASTAAAQGAVSFIGGEAPRASAIELYARPSPGFATKLHETVVTLLKAAATGPVTQASSLGAEDMVLTHLINQHRLPIEVFVLDTGALHAETLALLEQLVAELGLTLAFISHDLSVIRRLCTRILVLYRGEIVDNAMTTELYANPRAAYTRELLDAIPLPDPDQPWI